MILLVTGERDWDDRAQVEREIEKEIFGFNVEIGEVQLVIGDARSRDQVRGIDLAVDFFAEQWARRRGCPFSRHIAHWEELGAKAGPVRNSAMVMEMISSGHAVKRGLAFWSGRLKQSGTFDTFQKCTTKGIPVRIVPRRAA